MTIDKRSSQNSSKVCRVRVVNIKCHKKTITSILCLLSKCSTTSSCYMQNQKDNDYFSLKHGLTNKFLGKKNVFREKKKMKKFLSYDMPNSGLHV